MTTTMDISSSDPINHLNTTTPSMAVCCMCALSIQPNPTHMCLQCLRTQVREGCEWLDDTI